MQQTQPLSQVHENQCIGLIGPNRVSSTPSHLRTEADPVSETLCSLVTDDGQSPKTQ
jgi:hypothetical protein